MPSTDKFIDSGLKIVRSWCFVITISKSISFQTFSSVHIKKGTKFKSFCAKMWMYQCFLNNAFCCYRVWGRVSYMLASQGLYENFYSQTSHLSPHSFGILFKRTRGVCPIFPRMLGRMLGALVLWWKEEKIPLPLPSDSLVEICHI